jgi:hypothetical protein
MTTKTAAALPAATAWDWLKPEDAIRHALAAYYGACREAEQLAADPETRYATQALRASWWLDEMCRAFTGRVEAEAIKAGYPGFTETPAFGGSYVNSDEYVDNRLLEFDEKTDIHCRA